MCHKGWSHLTRLDLIVEIRPDHNLILILYRRTYHLPAQSSLSPTKKLVLPSAICHGTCHGQRQTQTDNQSVDTSYKLVDALVASIRRRHIVGSRNAAIATATLIKNIVRHVKYSTVEELISIIKAIGKRLMDANPRGKSSVAS